MVENALDSAAPQSRRSDEALHARALAESDSIHELLHEVPTWQYLYGAKSSKEDLKNLLLLYGKLNTAFEEVIEMWVSDGFASQVPFPLGDWKRGELAYKAYEALGGERQDEVNPFSNCDAIEALRSLNSDSAICGVLLTQTGSRMGGTRISQKIVDRFALIGVEEVTVREFFSGDPREIGPAFKLIGSGIDGSCSLIPSDLSDAIKLTFLLHANLFELFERDAGISKNTYGRCIRLLEGEGFSHLPLKPA